MSHELVIQGGTIVDGTGADPFNADLAIDDGRISAIEKGISGGREVIDARAMTVSPGFIDLHTHLDAQIGWDPDLTPVSWHGVTTALLGNCGVTFAPCRPTDRELLAGMMETVEDIPRHAILSGLPWTWEDYRGYLDAVEKLHPGLNVAGMVGHCAVRFYVMGERAVEEQATDEERRRMAEIVGQSIEGGAVGFSTNRHPPHVLPDGRSIPGTFANPIELVEITKQVWERRALVQFVGGDRDALLAILGSGNGRFLFSYGAGDDQQTGIQRRELLDRMCDGRDITAITQVRGSGGMFGLQSPRLPVRGQSWRQLSKLSFAERVSAIGDPEFSAKLIEETKRENAVPVDMNYVYYLGAGTSPDYTDTPTNNLMKIAAEAGEHWSETFLRLSRETQGKALFNFIMHNRSLRALSEVFKSKNCFPSLGDAGAHVSQMIDAGWPSFVLSHWVRSTGLYSMPEAIRRMTSGPARVIGLKDRGTLKVGMRADVNVFDADKVAELQPQMVHDFPGGAPRWTQRSTGFKATIVNGKVNVLDGEHTGVHAGMVLRHGR
ncbi:MAG TPA: amidohydrolase family protein [Candidatus Binataceae bacterium]|nr:amidohydrolase family protein [Candidatus Binataceae bacterium]